MTCLGRAKGTAAILLACGTGNRCASAHAVITLRLHTRERIDGPADGVQAQLTEQRAVRQQVLAILAGATRRDADELDNSLDHGTPLDAQAVAAWGLIDPA